MPSWKKILQSGSAVHVLNITASSLPNSFQPNIIGYNTASGRFTFFSTSSLVSGGSIIGGSGLTNYIPKWSNSTTLTSSIIFDNGTNVGIGTTSPTAKLQVLDSFTVSASSGQFADVKFRLLTQSYKNHVLTYDETTGQIYYFSSSLQATTPTCNPPIPDINVMSSLYVCSGSGTILEAANLNHPPIGTLTYQWSASGTPILDATTSRYEPTITADTTFTITMCDGVCCNTASVDIYVKPHNTITLSSSAGTVNQAVTASTSITPITYITTGATGATYTGLPSGVSGSWSAGPPDTITIGGVPTQTGTFNYTVTMTDGCTGGVNTATGSITVNGTAGTHQISGSVTYNNTAQTPMTNTVVQLLDSSGGVQATATTNSTGYYQMNFDLTAIGGPGSYSLKAVPTKPWGGVNSVDALAIARSFTGAAPLVGLRLAAADVNGSNTINSLDSLLVTRRFSGERNSFIAGDWRSEVLPIFLANSPTQYTQNLQVICFGDVNGSYVPSTSL
jgi:hypothetical protein